MNSFSKETFYLFTDQIKISNDIDEDTDTDINTDK